MSNHVDPDRRAVFFDVDGVLVHGYNANPDKCVRWDEHMERDLGISPDQFRKHFIFDIFIEKVIVGKMALIDALALKLPELGYEGSPVKFAQYWLAHDSNINLELLDFVSRIAASNKVDLYIATNQEHLRAMWIWHNLGMHRYFADIFYSARLGALKPSSSYFEQIDVTVGQRNLPPLFFDDSPQVIDGARNHGWESVQFNGLDDAKEHPFLASLFD